ncbi:putative methyltransferase-domain-containing protein [Dipodascopsis uninucleata]
MEHGVIEEEEAVEPLKSLLTSIDLIPLAQDTTKFAGQEYVTSSAGVMPISIDGIGINLMLDGGAAGCGGKVWPAGDVLSRYLINARTDTTYLAHKLVWNQAEQKKIRIIELGSGTGLVGLMLGKAFKSNITDGQMSPTTGMNIIISDQINMMSLMEKNITLNSMDDIVRASVIDWGTKLDKEILEPFPDVILAADCVYFEPAFPLLYQTLLDLSNKDSVIFMSYKKRRRADVRFFKSIKKDFVIEEIKNYKEYLEFSRETVFLYRLIRKH